MFELDSVKTWIILTLRCTLYKWRQKEVPESESCVISSKHAIRISREPRVIADHLKVHREPVLVVIDYLSFNHAQLKNGFPVQSSVCSHIRKFLCTTAYCSP